MIRFPANHDELRAADRFALRVLIDASRLLPAVPDLGETVRLEVVDIDSLPDDLAAFVTHKWFFERADGVVRIPRAALERVTQIAGAAVEQGVTERDRYGRVPSARNPTVQAGFERTPVVSAAGVALRQAVVDAAGQRPVRVVAPWPAGKRWAAALTHDLDVVEAWPVFAGLRFVELMRKGRVGIAARVAGAALRAVGRDPVWHAAQTLLQQETARGVRSTWFVLCGTPTVATRRAGDLTYRPEGAKATRLLRAVASVGHEMALHGSFETVDRPDAFREQRARLERIVGRTVTGVRQHYVRMVPGATQRGMHHAGFSYDATFGFPDRNGFRLGVADVVPWWDAAAETVTGLEQVPLMWMDRAQSKYQGIEDPDAWIDDAAALAAEARAVQGAWVGVWHPNLAPALGFPGAAEAYTRLLNELLETDPWITTLEPMVAWRRWRRSARAVGLTPTEVVEVRTDGASPHPLHVEDAEGGPVQATTSTSGRHP